MNFEQARFNMVEQQIRPWEVLDQDVLDLLYVVPREAFVPSGSKKLAFSDIEIPIGEGECMWAPRIEARAMQALGVRKSDRVLEVGTGSGYLTALLAHRAAHVHSVEIKPKLAEMGRANLARHGVENITLEVGDGARGFGSGEYDAIVLTGSVPVFDDAICRQLKPGGRVFAVVGEPPVMTARIVRWVAPGSFTTTEIFETVVAPLHNVAAAPRFVF